MSISISNGTTTVMPLDVLGYTISRQSQNVFHNIIGTATAIDATLIGAGLRSGTFTFLFDDEDDAVALESLYTGREVLTYADSDRPSITGMVHALSGTLTRAQDDSRTVWTVSVDWQELS
ncbi:hypothetical protein [Curtobacterium sp. MCBD17_040]|uniref:hypothetical protein n=1 Tax=Curtobacterium sp. MCBD17_040 TaxID=2175674 RepID=UPI0011B7B5C3|nr:hypothetical protein [Curtobacterium sp. MCBD17_040]WIB64366.1 hypothetical protein DEI94_03995 [Curtobacterium sp. MCBD17_040]